MAKTLAILNHKGGVGKTTTAINLGDALHLLGKRVLLIDLDPQRNASYIMGFEDGDGTTVFESLIDRKFETPLPQYQYLDGFNLCPASDDLKDIDSYLDNRRVGPNRALRKLLAPLQETYDFIIIDCPPSLGILTLNAMTASNGIIVPINRQLSLVGMTDILEMIEAVKEDNTDLQIEGCLFTDFDRRLRAVKTTKAAIEDNNIKTFNSRIRHNEALTFMVEQKQSIFGYNPTSIGAEDYMQLAQEISGVKTKKTIQQMVSKYYK